MYSNVHGIAARSVKARCCEALFCENNSRWHTVNFVVKGFIYNPNLKKNKNQWKQIVLRLKSCAVQMLILVARKVWYLWNLLPWPVYIQMMSEYNSMCQSNSKVYVSCIHLSGLKTTFTLTRSVFSAMRECSVEITETFTCAATLRYFSTSITWNHWSTSFEFQRKGSTSRALLTS